MLKKCIVIFLSLLFFFSMNNLAWPNEGKIETIGFGDNRNNAYKDACRQAIEQGLGVLINSQTSVKNSMVVKDWIKSTADGYVTDVEVMEEKPGKDYEIRIRAVVKKELFQQDFNSVIKNIVARLESPTIGFLLTAWDSNNQKADSKTTQALNGRFNEAFKSRNFIVSTFDEAMSIAVSQNNHFVDERSKIRQVAMQVGAKYIARGELVILSSNGNNTSLRLASQLIDVNSGEILGSYSNSLTLDKSNEEAIEEICNQAVEIMISQTVKHWNNALNNGQRFVVYVKNIKNLKQKTSFTKILRTLPGFEGISSQSYPKQGVLRLEVLYRGSEEEIEEAIGGSDLNLKSQLQGNNTLVFIFR